MTSTASNSSENHDSPSRPFFKTWGIATILVAVFAVLATNLVTEDPITHQQAQEASHEHWLEHKILPAALQFRNRAKVIYQARVVSDSELDDTLEQLQQQQFQIDDRAKPLAGLTVVITGATSGIGLGLTRVIAMMGAHVIAIGRSPKKLQALQEEVTLLVSSSSSNDQSKNRDTMTNSIDNSSNSSIITPILIDLTDLNSVGQGADEIIRQFPTIDLLINNAGMHNQANNLWVPAPTPQGYDLVFTVNYLSHFLLTEKLLPLLQRPSHTRTVQPHIIQISSLYHMAVDGSDLVLEATTGTDDGGIQGTGQPIASVPGGHHGFLAFRNQRQYANSKMAQILHARALSRRLKQRQTKSPLNEEEGSIRIVSACPGWVATEIAGIERGTFARTMFERLAYSSSNTGLSSILGAWFSATPSVDNEDKTDFFMNSLPSPFLIGVMDKCFASRLLYLYTPVCDSLGFLLAVWALATQSMQHTTPANVTDETGSTNTQQTSPGTYDTKLQDEFYDWSRKAVEPWL